MLSESEAVGGESVRPRGFGGGEVWRRGGCEEETGEQN